MKIEDLGKDTNFKLLNIKQEVVDEVMERWQFKDQTRMFESGVLILHALTLAEKGGAKRILFEGDSKDGKPGFYVFDFVGLIDEIKKIDGTEPLSIEKR